MWFWHLASWYEGWSKSLFLFLIQRKVRILSKFCDVYIEIKYITSNWMIFEKQLWHHSLWHVTSHDIAKGVIVVNRFSGVSSAKFEIFFRSKKHSIPLRNGHLKLIAADIAVEQTAEIYTFFHHFLILQLFYTFLCVINALCNAFSCL